MDAFAYSLPWERIAQQPILPPEAAKLLVWRGKDVPLADSTFGALESWLPAHSTLVFNDTKVVPARMVLYKASGARIEVFLLEPYAPQVYEEAMRSTTECTWRCLVGNAKKWNEETLTCPVPGGVLEVTHEAFVSDNGVGGNFIAHFRWTGGESFSGVLQAVGEIPIPPYLNRATCEEDATWYQTVYAHWEGSVAAPTAGLHFSESMLRALASSGHELLYTTLHVGAGTFLPVKSETIGGHAMHAERVLIARSLVERLLATEGKIIAVGTTSLRALESLYWYGVLLGQKDGGGAVSQWTPYSGLPEEGRSVVLRRLLAHLSDRGLEVLELTTSLLIAPPYRLKMAEGLVTNFHQPCSTLLLLVSAVMGGDWRRMYEHALGGGYRFLSYGDGCLIMG